MAYVLTLGFRTIVLFFMYQVACGALRCTQIFLPVCFVSLGPVPIPTDFLNTNTITATASAGASTDVGVVENASGVRF